MTLDSVLPTEIMLNHVGPSLDIISLARFLQTCKFLWSFINQEPFAEILFWRKLLKLGRASDGLALAIEKRRFELLPIFNKNAENFKYAFGSAARIGDLELVQFYLDKMKPDDYKEQTLQYGMYFAAKEGRMKVVQFLLSRGQYYARGGNSENIAAYNGQLEVLKLLFEIPKGSLNQALAKACWGGQKQVYDWLVTQKPDYLIHKNPYLLCCALTGSNIEIIQDLMKRGFHVSEEQLRSAAFYGQMEMADFVAGRRVLDQATTEKAIKRQHRLQEQFEVFMWKRFRIAIGKTSPETLNSHEDPRE